MYFIQQFVKKTVKQLYLSILIGKIHNIVTPWLIVYCSLTAKQFTKCCYYGHAYLCDFMAYQKKIA